MAANTSTSGGGVVLNRAGQVLVVSQHGTSWSLPKGKVEPGEDTRTAAVREIAEESGVTQLEYVKPLGTYQRYRIGKHGGEDQSEFKTIEIFLYTTQQTKLQPQDPHNPEARWVEPAKVVELLTHPKDKQFFVEAWDTVRAFIDNQKDSEKS